MSFQTKHGLYGLSSSYDLSFFQPHPETDGKFSSGASVILAYARLRRGKKKKSPVKHRIRIELDWFLNMVCHLNLIDTSTQRRSSNTGLCIS